MIRAGRIGVVPPRERRLVNPFGGHYRHLVGDQRWQQVPVQHQNRGKLWKLLHWRVPPRLALVLGLEPPVGKGCVGVEL